MKQFSEVAHLYIGCEVEFGFEGRKKIGKLVGKVEPFGLHVFDPSNVFVPYHNVRDELIKARLIPLSGMTEEEFTEAAKIHVACGGTVAIRLHSLKNGDRKPTYPEVFTYLLSRSFDLFGLIESGQAIDKTKKS